MELNLKGKLAIVTGAGGYIGREVALCLAREGADVVVADKEMERKATTWSTLEGAKKVAEEVRALGRRAIAVQADVTKMKEAEQMVQAALAEFGKIDILCNLAGGGARDTASPLSEQTEEVWDEVFSRNLNTTRNCCKAVINHMLDRKSGKIVNIGSGNIFSGGSAGETAYAAGKAAVQGFTYALAKEVEKSGIRVNCMTPGGVGQSNTPDDIAAARGSFGRRGKPEEAADLMTFLASDKGDFISGQFYPMGGPK